MRFRSRSRRRRRRLRARGTRRRDVAHRGNRRKGHPTMSPRARRVATASTLPAAGPRTRREMSSSERARFTAVGRSERSGFRAAARLPSPRSHGPASQRLARSLARGSAHAARCLGRVAHRNPRPNCGRRARTTHRDGRERCDYNTTEGSNCGNNDESTYVFERRAVSKNTLLCLSNTVSSIIYRVAPFSGGGDRLSRDRRDETSRNSLSLTRRFGPAASPCTRRAAGEGPP